MTHLRYTKGRSFVVEAILKALSEYGPMTRSAICRTIGRERTEVASVVSRLNKNLPSIPKRVYICEWVHDDDEGRSSYPRAVYALGDKPDKRKPARQSSASVNKRWREAQKLKVNSIFELGVSIRSRNERRKQTSGTGASGWGPLQEPKDSADAIQHDERVGPVPTYDH